MDASLNRLGHLLTARTNTLNRDLVKHDTAIWLSISFVTEVLPLEKWECGKKLGKDVNLLLYTKSLEALA